jgi:glutamyl-tRNA reductase
MNEFAEWYNMRCNVPFLKAVKQKLIDMHQCDLFLSIEPAPGHNLCPAKEVSIQKAINNMAIKMRQQRKPGCNYIEAINDFITSSRSN